jgi:hypothetical protein
VTRKQVVLACLAWAAFVVIFFVGPLSHRYSGRPGDDRLIGLPVTAKGWTSMAVIILVPIGAGLWLVKQRR